MADKILSPQELKEILENSTSPKKRQELRRVILESFKEINPYQNIKERDYANIIKYLHSESILTKGSIDEATLRVIEENAQEDLRIVVAQLVKANRPRGFKVSPEVIEEIIKRGKLRGRTATIPSIRAAIKAYFAGPRRVEDIPKEEILDVIRQELTKLGAVDAVKVNKIYREFIAQNDPGAQYRIESLRKLIKASSGSPVTSTTAKDKAREKNEQSKNPSGLSAGAPVPPVDLKKLTFFERMRLKLGRQGLRSLTQDARLWFTDTVQKARRPTDAQLFKDARAIQSVEEAFIGKMLLYSYRAKHEKTLPYWDAFPLIFVIEVYSDGWLGLNLHYLPIPLRMQLFDALLQLADNKTLDKVKKLALSYRLLKGFARFPLARPCLKKYLSGYIQSTLLPIAPIDWETALFLPVERFQKRQKATVWKDSERIIREKS
jgi:hypothetical protein